MRWPFALCCASCIPLMIALSHSGSRARVQQKESDGKRQTHQRTLEQDKREDRNNSQRSKNRKRIEKRRAKATVEACKGRRSMRGMSSPCILMTAIMGLSAAVSLFLDLRRQDLKFNDQPGDRLFRGWMAAVERDMRRTGEGHEGRTVAQARRKTAANERDNVATQDHLIA